MQPERYKSKEDTWSNEELTRHMKAMQSEGINDRRHKERRHHRDEGRDEHARRRHRPEEKIDERERPKHPERDRHADRDRGDPAEHRREKEKVRDGDRDKYHMSERHRTKDREKTREKTGSGEKPVKEYGTSDLSRVERKMRDSLEKSKHRSEDRERRHLERREKEGRRHENEEHEDRNVRHHKQSEEFNNQDGERERRRSDRKHREASDREKRHHSRRESGTHSDQRSAEEAAARSERDKEKHSREGYSHDGDKEQRHRDRKDRRTRAHETKSSDVQENISVHKSRFKESLAEKESNDEKEIEETLYNADTANDESTNYEEDFEDYDDDFEDGSEEDKTPEPKAVSRSAEVAEIQKAMLLENESIVPATLRHKAYDQQDEEPNSEGQRSTPRKSVQRGVFIDFGSAKQRQASGQISSKQKKRSLEILRLIDLDFSSTFSLLDLPPVKEYEMYIRNFGKTNTKQAYVQCNEDAVDREIQTEEIDHEEKWTQHPREGAAVCGGHKNDAVHDIGVVTKVDSQRLTAFLRSACQVMTVLLEENRAEMQSNHKAQSKDHCLSISDSCFLLNTNLNFLQGRSVYQLQFSEAQRHLLLTVHGLGNSNESISLCDKYIICIWNIWQPSTPLKILICESEVRCCCFSPGKASLVFAGTADGSVLVWDLREDISMHQTMMIQDANWTFRSATFSTDGIFTQVSHTHAVKAIAPVPSAETKDHGISSLSSAEEMSGLSFQVASLDESGHLILWVVVELRKVDLAGSQSDLGLIPGGKVKLIHSSSIHLSDKFFHKDVLMLGSPQTLDIKFLPRDFNHFVVGTDIGLVTHGTRYGLVEPPMQYTSLHTRLRPSQVTAIDFSPFGVSAFLAGGSDGSIRLHTMSTEFPAMQWSDSTDGRSVTTLQWSLTRPTVFFVLDAASSIYIWDLSQNDLHPIAKESIMPDQVLSMSVYGEPEKNNNIMALALGKSSGKVEIQYIKKKIAKSQPEELEKLHLILQGI